MKKKSKAIKGFHAVDFFRKVKDKISQETKDMNFEELKAYLEKNKLKRKDS